MKVIGLTGGIASGKSTVSRYLREKGAAILDADAIAHALAEPGGSLYQAYRRHFGAAVLQADGRLDRAAIGKIVFAQPEERAWIDRSAHPLIQAEIKRQLYKLSQSLYKHRSHGSILPLLQTGQSLRQE